MTRCLHRSLRSICAISLALTVFVGVRAASAAPAKGTEILWDTWGIPHITAADHPSLFYAYGYAQMEAHSELLVRLYAQARGRGAEFYGEQYLDADRWVRTNGIPSRAKEWAKGQSPEFGPFVVAFVEGLNAWASEHRADLSPAAKGVLLSAFFWSYAIRRCLRALPARHSLRLDRQPRKTGRASEARRSRCARFERMGDRALVLGVGQGDAAQ